MYDTRLAVVISGRTCTTFDLSGQSIHETGTRSFENEISCIHVPIVSTNFIVIGFWTSSSVAVLNSAGLSTLVEEPLQSNEGVVPRALLVTKILADKPSTLFVSMGDGEVFSFTIADHVPHLTEKKSINLGTQAVTFEITAHHHESDTVSVFATGERPTMIYEEEGRIVYSAITVDRTTTVTAFNAEAYPDSVILATDEDLRIAKVDDIRTTHTRTLPFQQFVRRVVFLKEQKVYVAAAIQTQIEEASGMEISRCYVHVVDENFHDKVARYELDNNELPESMICMKLQNSDGSESEKIVLGTGIGNKHDDGEKGRILVFELGDDRIIRLVTSLDIPAACHTLANLNGSLVAGINKQVRVYNFFYPENSMSPLLEEVATARANTIPVALSTVKNKIFVGDLMKGVMVLEYRPDEVEKKDKLIEVCRQYGVSWVTALEALDESLCLSADSDCNLTLLARDAEATNTEDARRMGCLSELRLGEMVNAIRRGKKHNDSLAQQRSLG